MGIRKIAELLRIDVGNVEWRAVFTRPHKSTVETYMKCFQYKIIHNILPVNKKLHTWKLKKSPLCDLCGAEEETVVHLFAECRSCSTFWDDFNRWAIQHLNFSKKLTPIDIIFGIDDVLINYCITIAKYCIFKQKEKGEINFHYFCNFLKSKCELEKRAASNSGKWPSFLRKWERYLKE